MKEKRFLGYRLVFVWLSIGLSSLAIAAEKLDVLVGEQEAVLKKLHEPLEPLRGSYIKHLEKLQKDFADKGNANTVAVIREAIKAGDPRPADLSELPELRKAQARFLELKKKLLEPVEAEIEAMCEDYFVKLGNLQSELKEKEDKAAVVDTLFRAKKEFAPVLPEVGEDFKITGRFHCSVDDSASLYINGERFLKAKYGHSKSALTELGVGDVVIFSARNHGGAKCFKAAFVADDLSYYVSFKAHDLKGIDEKKNGRNFEAQKIDSIKRLANVCSDSPMAASFPFESESDWVWESNSHALMSTVIRPDMIKAGKDPLLAKVETPKKPTSTIRIKIVRKLPDGTEVTEIKEITEGGIPGMPIPLIPGPGMPAPREETDAKFVDNFADEWPNSVSTETSAEVTAVKEDPDGKVFVYHSKHFEFISDARLSLNVIRKLSRQFEATLEYCKALPISTQKAHISGKKRHRIELFREEVDYLKNGGIPGSAGVFISGRNVVLVPLKHVGVTPAGSGFRVDYDKKNKTLPHEIVHQLTDYCYYSAGARGWFTEGLAEYVALTPYRNSGTYSIRTNRDSIMEGVTAFGEDRRGGRNLGKEIKIQRTLSHWMTMPYSEFAGADIGKNYGVAALVTYYFFHMDGGGDRKAITEFLKALRAGKRGQPALDVLLQGRSWGELGEDIRKGWRSRGIKLTWAAED